jgi:hypothetical protein
MGSEPIIGGIAAIKTAIAARGTGQLGKNSNADDTDETDFCGFLLKVKGLLVGLGRMHC